MQRVADPTQRAEAGIRATESELESNPYLICEMDQGTQDSDPVGLDAVDHGMKPEGDAALFEDEVVHPEDERRVRAVAAEVLKTAAAGGDTVLPIPELFDRVRKRFSERRRCQPDVEVFRADIEFHEATLWAALDERPQIAALRSLRVLESSVVDLVRARAGKSVAVSGLVPDWTGSLVRQFGEPASERERSAFREKEAALRTLFGQKLSILTGGAGTGKTSVLQVFLSELERVEGKQPLLLLAPTGKARVRLATKTKRSAMTIHQLLLKLEWVWPETFSLKASGRRQISCNTVVVDECSMIPTDLLGTLLAALDTGLLKRLVLVGDPNQLPPIGPGRPFVDIINWVDSNRPSSLARLLTCMRVVEGAGQESVALGLADGYRSDVVHPGDDDILSRLGRGENLGDLECVFWQDPVDLVEKLRARLSSLLGVAPKDYVSFNKSLGIDGKSSDYAKSEAWQILCPTRVDLHGTSELNRVLQSEYRRGILTNCRARRGDNPRPFGEREIVWCDKVIQIRNRRGKAWPAQPDNLNYIANGEIGIVKSSTKNAKGDYFDVVFSTQPAVSYRYWRNQTDTDLELGYALTVHKAQGSDFDVVFLIISQSATTLSREMVYTGLTRFRTRLVLLLEKDLGPLLSLRNPAASDTQLRNTHMFELVLRPEGSDVFRPDGLIHRTRKGVAVRSKSEVVVADTLASLGISYEYEKPLSPAGDPRNFRLPDFTVGYQGDVYYWEHLGMLTVPSYREAWEKKLAWYEACGFKERLITSEDSPAGGIDATVIERIARERILGSP